MRLAILALACSTLTVPAFASRYIFGYSSGAQNSGNVQLILNGSTAINSTEGGWYDSTGSHTPSNDNYITGFCVSGTAGCGQTLAYRNWFTFDIPTAIDITSASLRLYSHEYFSTNSSELFGLFDITSDIDSLIAGTGGIAAFNDFGTGEVYGSRVYTGADSYQFHTIGLNATALAAIQAAVGSRFALAGAIDPDAVVVINPVPEPSSILLGASALAGLAIYRRRRSNA